MRPQIALTFIIALSGCVAARPDPQQVEPPLDSAVPELPAEIDFPHAQVWTAFGEVPLMTSSGTVPIARPFTALDVLGADTEGIRVRCAHCPGEPTGRVRHDHVVHTTFPPATAAWGSLSQFALAVRDAAARGDTVALRPIMAGGFTFSFIGIQGVPQALAAWGSDGLSTLVQVPALLDQGLSPMRGGVWAAPPQFAESLGYNGLRLGFRRSPAGSWEWLFLLRGEGP